MQRARRALAVQSTITRMVICNGCDYDVLFVPTDTNILIILRGPSGAGKTTVAKTLFACAGEKTALIQQDHYRSIFNPPGGGSKNNAKVVHQMVEHNTKAALKEGYTVILEGILSPKSYGAILDRIISEHTGPSHIFHFDISFDETLARHKTKDENSAFGEAEMRVWFPVSHKSDHELERLIPESFTSDETVQHIVDVTGYNCDVSP